jgi:hypothetical protein
VLSVVETSIGVEKPPMAAEPPRRRRYGRGGMAGVGWAGGSQGGVGLRASDTQPRHRRNPLRILPGLPALLNRYLKSDGHDRRDPQTMACATTRLSRVATK